MDSPLEIPEGTPAYWHFDFRSMKLILDFWPPKCWDNKFLSIIKLWQKSSMGGGIYFGWEKGFILILQRLSQNQNHLLPLPRTGQVKDVVPSPHLSCGLDQVSGQDRGMESVQEAEARRVLRGRKWHLLLLLLEGPDQERTGGKEVPILLKGLL